MKHTCPCGRPAHPCYQFMCEDCWVDTQVVRRPYRPREGPVISSSEGASALVSRDPYRGKQKWRGNREL